MSVFADRRRRLIEAMGSGVAIFPSALPRTRSNDVDYRYRPDSDLHYLTGMTEPGALLIVKPSDPEARTTLLVRPRDLEREVWTGPRVGVERAAVRFGVDRAASIEELPAELDRALSNEERIYFKLGRFPEVEHAIHAALRQLARRNREGIDAPSVFVDPGKVVSEMRLVKRAGDLEPLRKAVEITVSGHLEAMRTVRPGLHEYDLEAIVEYVFRRRGGSGPSFPSTVGSGPNGCYLHFQGSARRLEPGELVLVDAGAEYEMFAGDLTRTYPVGGRFSPAQARIYGIVLDAHGAALSRIRPGARFQDVHDAALEVLTAGLIDLGFIDGPLGHALEKDAYKPFYMHRTSHWLGVDVHDVGTYRNKGQWRSLEPGHVITVEPGLYIRENLPRVGPEFQNTGVRIEDDVLVTEAGLEVLSDGLPRTIADLESELARPRRP